MVIAKKGKQTVTIPLSIYKKHYEALGWSASDVNPLEVPKQNTIPPLLDESDIHSMSVQKLREYAEQNGIDVSEANSKKEILAIIEAAKEI